jgi:hypothetical protein
MIARLRSWYASRRRVTKILLGAGGILVSLVVLYAAARAVQYAGASRTSAGLFVPEGAEVIVRVEDLAGRWKAVQQTELWKSFTRRLQKDAAIRASLNELLAEVGAPTLDQLEDRRWLDRNPLMQESSILRYGGRDFVFSSTGDKFCVATRIGLFEYLLLPGLQIFPGAVGAERVKRAWGPILKRGDLFISVQGAMLVASNDAAMLESALKRRGAADKPRGLVHASLKPQPLLPALKGFPLGALLAVADLDTCRRIEVDVEITGADLVVRAKADGLKARQSEPAPVDTVRMIPANGLGACVTNVEAAVIWEWLRGIGDRRARGGSGVARFIRDSIRDVVDVLQGERFGEDLVPKLDGPVSILFGASEGEDGKTYAAVALYFRSSQPREAGEALQGIIDRAIKPRKEFQPLDDEAGGVTFRSYRFDPDPFRFNNFLVPCYAVTGDALILANNRIFLQDALKCRANQAPAMAVQLHYVQAMRRLQDLGMKKVMAPGGAASLFLYGPAIRQGLEGFYGTLASTIVDTPMNKSLLRQELETAARKEGHPIKPADLDDHVRRILDERIHEKEDALRAGARILDYLKWVAYQAETVNDGMKIEFAIELK